jgi:hypothetical protein
MNPQKPSLEELIATARMVSKSWATFMVRDIRATVRWYEAIGFTLQDEYSERGQLFHAQLTNGNGDFMLGPANWSEPSGGSMRFVSDRVELLCDAFKQRQMPFEEELHTASDGGREFSIRDLDGVTLIFSQPA